MPRRIPLQSHNADTRSRVFFFLFDDKVLFFQKSVSVPNRSDASQATTKAAATTTTGKLKADFCSLKDKKKQTR
jgi:hypothetical protein